MAATDDAKQRKLDLQQRLAESRQSISGAKILLCEQLTEKKTAFKNAVNVPARLKHSIQKKPAQWFIGALISGVAATALRRRSKPAASVKPSRPLLLTLLISLMRPIIKTFIMNKLQAVILQRMEAKYTPNTPRY